RSGRKEGGLIACARMDCKAPRTRRRAAFRASCNRQNESGGLAEAAARNRWRIDAGLVAARADVVALPAVPTVVVPAVIVVAVAVIVTVAGFRERALRGALRHFRRTHGFAGRLEAELAAGGRGLRLRDASGARDGKHGEARNQFPHGPVLLPQG